MLWRKSRLSKRGNLLLFLIGMFSLTQVTLVGNIGISELFIALVFPFVFMQDLQLLKRDGCSTAIWLCLLACLGCCISSWVNHSRLVDFLRGFASPYMLAACITVFHRLLRRNIDGYRWVLVGIAVSGIINIFFFQYGAEAALSDSGSRGLEAADAVTDSSLFLTGHIAPWLRIPVQCWYDATPLWYSVLAPVVLAAFTMFTTSSGRSATAVALSSVLLIFYGGKSLHRKLVIQKNFWVLCLAGLIVAFGIKTVYKQLAIHHVLGEEAVKKYEKQSRGGGGMLQLLMGGRAEFFYCLSACLDRPFVGHGPWAVDTSGYYETYLFKYGAEDDVEAYMKSLESAQRRGVQLKGLYIGGHSYILSFWCWYGILGLPLWIYVLYLLVQIFKKHLAAIPMLYGFVCLLAPNFVWNIFFSPFGARVTQAFSIVVLLLIRAVGTGRLTISGASPVIENRMRWLR